MHGFEFHNLEILCAPLPSRITFFFVVVLAFFPFAEEEVIEWFEDLKMKHYLTNFVNKVRAGVDYCLHTTLTFICGHN